MTALYRRVDYPEGLETPVQFVGCYVLRWGELQDPTVGFYQIDGDEADLLDAAPDLLEALKNIRDTVESCHVAGGWVPLDAEEMVAIAEMSKAAIAKAKGE